MEVSWNGVPIVIIHFSGWENFHEKVTIRYPHDYENPYIAYKVVLPKLCLLVYNPIN